MRIEDLLPTLNSTSQDDRDFAITLAKQHFNEEELLDLRKQLNPSEDKADLWEIEGWTWSSRHPGQIYYHQMNEYSKLYL